MSLQLIGKKKGMTQIYDEKGNVVPCTVILVEPNFVTQIKTKERDGYQAVQLASCQKRNLKKMTRPLKGHYERAQVVPCEKLLESPLEDVSSYKRGEALPFSFEVGEYLDVVGISKGKGFQGVMKLHGFHGMRKSHGTGPVHRHAGSTGMRSTPGRCFKGGPRASHMGSDRVTQQNLKIVYVDDKRRLVLVKGAIPGHRESLVFLSKAKKKNHKK